MQTHHIPKYQIVWNLLKKAKIMALEVSNGENALLVRNESEAYTRLLTYMFLHISPNYLSLQPYNDSLSCHPKLSTKLFGC